MRAYLRPVFPPATSLLADTGFQNYNTSQRNIALFVPSELFVSAAAYPYRVTASGYKSLTTQHYPEEQAAEATFDLTLIPAQGAGHQESLTSQLYVVGGPGNI